MLLLRYTKHAGKNYITIFSLQNKNKNKNFKICDLIYFILSYYFFPPNGTFQILFVGEDVFGYKWFKWDDKST